MEGSYLAGNDVLVGASRKEWEGGVNACADRYGIDFAGGVRGCDLVCAQDVL
jgi:hypothetical protein